MRSMLQYAKTHVTGSVWHEDRLTRLIERCDIILDPAKVRRINTTLGVALEDNPGLEGIADVVVEVAGPGFLYAATEKFPSAVKDFERALLKSSGMNLLLTC